MHRQVSFYVYVDDIDIGSSGPARQVLEDTTGATRWLVQYLEVRLKAKVSRQKSRVLATSRALRQALSCRLRALRLGSGSWAKKLGTNFKLTNGRRAPTLRKRQRDLGRTAKRFAFLRKGAGRRIAASVHARGAIPAATFGVSVLGMADAPLRALRQASAAVAFQHSRLRSLNLSFLLLGKAGQDPAWSVHSLPLGAWARAVWGELFPLDDLFLAFEWAKSRFVGAQRPWLRVVGPAGAVVASLHRLGWQPLSAVEWVDDLGRHIHLRSSWPKSVVKWVHSAVDRWSWRQIAESHPDLAHLRDGACLEPIRGLIRKAGTSLSWGFKEGASPGGDRHWSCPLPEQVV